MHIWIHHEKQAFVGRLVNRANMVIYRM